MKNLIDARKRSSEEKKKIPKLKIHKSRLSLSDYLNEPEPPIVTRNQAIKLRCLDCCGNQRSEVVKCTAIKCSLWPYRIGSYQRPPQKEWKTRRVWDINWDKP
jgi:hypothetical protein